MILERLSVSQVTAYSVDQPGGCPRRWWFEAVQKRKPPQQASQEKGIKGHALIETYLKTGARPGRTSMGKHVNAAIDAGMFPAPSPELLVERRFTGQPRYDAAGALVPLDPARTPLWAAGVPFDGYIDLMYLDAGGAVCVDDHKFTSDVAGDHTKQAADLIKTIQMPGYALVGAALFPGATKFRLAHNYISHASSEQRDRRCAVVTLDQVRERWDAVEFTVQEMKAVARETAQGEVPFNRASCDAWMGCPHQTVCKAYKEKHMNVLSAEELEFFKVPPAAAKPAEPDTSFDFGANVAAGLPAKILETAIDNAVAAIVPPDGPKNDPALAAPKASLIMPCCSGCGVDLNPENSSQTRSGAFVHIGCTATAAPIAEAPKATPPPPAPVQSATPAPIESAPEAPKRRGRPPKNADKTVQEVAAENVAAAPAPSVPAFVTGVQAVQPDALTAPAAQTITHVHVIQFEIGPNAIEFFKALTGK